MLKKCNLCKEHKPMNDFSIDNHNKDGHKHVCKTCRRVIDNLNYMLRIDSTPKITKKQIWDIIIIFSTIIRNGL